MSVFHKTQLLKLFGSVDDDDEAPAKKATTTTTTSNNTNTTKGVLSSSAPRKRSPSTKCASPPYSKEAPSKTGSDYGSKRPQIATNLSQVLLRRQHTVNKRKRKKTEKEVGVLQQDVASKSFAEKRKGDVEKLNCIKKKREEQHTKHGQIGGHTEKSNFPTEKSDTRAKKSDTRAKKVNTRGKKGDTQVKRSGTEVKEGGTQTKDVVSSKISENKKRLEGARFRYINEMLYTSHSKEAARAFYDDPSSFDVYHNGYRLQIEKWPVKPIDLAIRYVKSRPKDDVVADLGCGEARLATEVPQRVHSYDMIALNDRVTVADMAKLPLPDGSVNVAVYCLSLMGTNIVDFIQEAHRVLVTGGIMWIAEVCSRFNGDTQSFTDSVEAVGFKCLSRKMNSTHFVTLTFKKGQAANSSNKAKKGRVDISLAPCFYKKR